MIPPRLPPLPPLRPLPLLLALAAGGFAACGPTEVLVGDAPGIARVVAGVLVTPFQLAFPDSAPVGDALTVPLGIPAGIAAQPDGGFYFADRGRRRVAHVSAAGSITWPVGRGACGAPGLGNGQPGNICFAVPEAVTVAANGALWVADARGHRVYRVELADQRATVVLGTGQAGVAPDGATAATSPTNGPSDLALGPDGAVYVAERNNHRVVRVDGDGLLRVVAGEPTPGDSGDGAPGSAARFRRPEGLAWLGDTLYVADAGNHRIRRLIRDSVFAFAGLGAPGFAGDRGPVAGALFRDPGRLAVAGRLLLVADRGNHRVRIIRVGPDSIDTFGGTGVATAGADLLEIGRTGLAGPTGVAAAGRAIFVSDSGGVVVRRVIR